MRGPVRWAARLLAGLACLMGLVWMGQGLGFIPGSFMTGQSFWFWMGLAFFGGGVAIVYATMRRP